MAIAYAIETTSGVRGILVDAFGVYSDPTTSAALKDVPITGKTAPTTIVAIVTSAESPANAAQGGPTQP